MATAKPAAAAAAPAAAPKPKSKLPLIIAAIVVTAAASGGGAWYFLGHKSAGATEHAKPAVAAPPVFAPMEAFTVNLQSDGAEQFLQTAFTLQVATQADVEAIKLYLPQVRSRVLLLLSAKHATDISTVEGKKKLAEEIMTQLKLPFAAHGAPLNVSDLFFTSFVIQ